MDLATLERYYKGISESSGHFHQGLLDYLEYIRNNDELKAIVSPLAADAVKQYEDYEAKKEQNKALKNDAKDKLPSVFFDDAFISVKNVELWGCWHDLQYITADSLINQDVWEEAVGNEEFPTEERLKSCASRIHNFILAEAGKPRSKKKEFSDNIDSKDLSHELALFMMKLIISRIFDIVEAVSTGYLGVTDSVLNAYYITLSDSVKDMLKREDFKKISESFPEDLPENLFQDVDELDIAWEDGGRRARLMNFLGDVETAWVRAGTPSIEVVGPFKDLLDNVDKAVENHRKIKAIQWDKTLKGLEAKRDSGELPFSTPKSEAPISPVASTIRIIEQQYKSFIDLTDSWGFFQGLADYVKTVESLAPTKAVVEALEKQRQVAEQALNSVSAKALKEFQDSAARISKVVKDMSIQSKPIMDAVRAVQKQLDEFNDSLNPLHDLDTKIFELARTIKESGYPEAVKAFEDENKKKKNIYGNYTFSNIYPAVEIEKSKLEKREQVEPWGAWKNLPLVEKAVFDADEKPDFYAQEMNALRKGEIVDDDFTFFNVKVYKKDAQRFHRYLHAELLKDGMKDGTSEIITAIDGAIKRGFDGMFQAKTDAKPALSPFENHDKKVPVPTIKIEGDYMLFGVGKIPVERGQKTMAQLFLDNAKIFRAEKVVQKGTVLNLNVYQKAGGYGSELAYRNGLKKLRDKIKKAKFPICIENPESKGYQMVIRYSRQQKQ